MFYVSTSFTSFEPDFFLIGLSIVVVVEVFVDVVGAGFPDQNGVQQRQDHPW